MRRVGANVAGASAVIVALALVASQTLFSAGRAVTPGPSEARPAPSSSSSSGTVAVSGDRDSREREVDGDEPRLAISEITSRARVAIREVLVGEVTEVEKDGASYEVEFDSTDDDLEVVLDRSFDLMVAEIDDDDPAPTADQVEQARAAARAMAALGDVIEVERDDDGFEVELARPDGTVLELDLDNDLNLVAVETESD